jgi:molybdate transport system substrate-binding protein
VRALAAGLVALALLPGCSGGSTKPRLLVSAASSLTEALTGCSKSFKDADVRLSFAGSDELAAQIRQGAKPDVFASANTALPEELHGEGRLSRPVEFATNELVIAVPRRSGEVHSVDDLADERLTLALGSASVPIGSYTREVLSRLPGDEGRAILSRVRSNEPDVKGIVGKLTQGAVDAGFVYRSDVDAAGDELRAIELPRRLQPTVVYGAGVVRRAREPSPARRYVEGLRRGPCARALREAGFGRPPSP